ncbi:MAG: ATP-grasp domain-containing protein [Dehalobacterium sp.]
MRILILGAGHNQLSAIKLAKEKGCTVIVTDYLTDAPGRKLADYHEQVSTFDIKTNIQVAKKHQVDGVMTLGTDQPVFTAAKVAAELGLPALISVETAKAVTNKKYMKKTFIDNNIPTVNYRLLKKNFSLEELAGIRFPAVIKPLDSQGQRGIYKLDRGEDIYHFFADVLSYSREEEILLEEYYPANEITINGWVEKGKTYILLITDRIVYNNYPHIGICTAQNFPPKFAQGKFPEIKEITEKIVRVFNIKMGPIYFQYLIGDQGLKVNEIACRIGGGHEDESIKFLTGIDILDLTIAASLGQETDSLSFDNFQMENIKKSLSMQFICAKPGIVHSLFNSLELIKMPGIKNALCNLHLGQEITQLTNASERIGYMMIEADNDQSLQSRIENAYRHYRVIDQWGNNLVMRF